MGISVTTTLGLVMRGRRRRRHRNRLLAVVEEDIEEVTQRFGQGGNMLCYGKLKVISINRSLLQKKRVI